MPLIPKGGELRKLRTRRGLTQSELARLAGVSQGWVARVEAGSVDPRVSTLEKILRVLNSVPVTIVAADIMSSPVISVDYEEKVRTAVEIMRRRDISQLPVMLRGRPVGGIEEDKILKKLVTNLSSPEKVYEARVGDLISSVYPLVYAETSLAEVADLLSRGHAAVLVMEGVALKGIITKIDVITAFKLQREGKT
ncbi:MAG: CBS domain-containing protein [Thermoproteota archaeon]